MNSKIYELPANKIISHLLQSCVAGRFEPPNPYTSIAIHAGPYRMDCLNILAKKLIPHNNDKNNRFILK